MHFNNTLLLARYGERLFIEFKDEDVFLNVILRVLQVLFSTELFLPRHSVNGAWEINLTDMVHVTLPDFSIGWRL